MILAAGVYPELVEAIAELTSGRFRRLSATRLVVTVGCALVAVFGVAGTARDAFTAWPVVCFALFLGLTLGGAPLLWRMASGPGRVFAAGAVAGALAVVLPILLAVRGDAEATAFAASAPAFFGAGAVAAFAMVLPGISGSTLLLLMGMYLPFLDAADRLADTLGRQPWDSAALLAAIAGVLPFFFGIACGMAAAARLVRYFLGAYPQATLGVLFGSAAGSDGGSLALPDHERRLFRPHGRPDRHRGRDHRRRVPVHLLSRRRPPASRPVIPAHSSQRTRTSCPRPPLRPERS